MFGDAAAWFRTVIREMDAEYLGIRAPTAAGQILNETPLSDVKACGGCCDGTRRGGHQYPSTISRSLSKVSLREHCVAQAPLPG